MPKPMRTKPVAAAQVRTLCRQGRDSTYWLVVGKRILTEPHRHELRRYTKYVANLYKLCLVLVHGETA